jgi:hypothetical protein
MGCCDDRKKYTGIEKNTELAQICADMKNLPQLLISTDNGRTWSFTAIDGIYKKLILPTKKVKAKK